MAAQYLRKHPEVLRRSDCPRIPGRPLTFIPDEVRAYARKRSTAYLPSSTGTAARRTNLTIQ